MPHPKGNKEFIFSGIERNARRHPERPALIFLGEKISYGSLKLFIDQFATALHDLGLRKNDKCLLYIPNCPQWVIAYMALQKIGAVPVPISPIYTPNEIEYLINDSQSETVICQDVNFGYIERVFHKTCLKRVIVTNLVELLPWWKKTLGRLFNRAPGGAVAKNPEVYFFLRLLNQYPPDPPKVAVNPSDHIAYILYTGGTTSMPRGVPGSHKTLLSYKDGYDEMTQDYLKDGKETLILAIPLFHIMAQGTIIGLALNRGNTTALMPFPEIDPMLEAIQKYKATLFIGAPALYRLILENDRLNQYDLSALKYCWVGGDMLPRQIYRQWKRKFGMPIYQTYGTTEALFICGSPLGEEPPEGSIGRPFSFIKHRIVDPKTLAPVPLNAVGELLTTFEFCAQSYWDKPEETKKTWVEIDNEKWCRTGDYIRMRDDGLFYYVDRIADIIKYKGYRISCSEVEAVLKNHPAVMDACVVGVPDTAVGERVKALAVLKENARGISSAELMRWCGTRLAPYKIPKYIEFRDMLPKSKVGKLLRREIRDEERRRMGKGRE
ncbi:AMP-dependent synthetase [Candidatus Desulfarcum epimagneticum]|uniref:AMP-dependent synthetase n=1 Tax=uncultured Desulfobacteraceae bacterium TaxID=218296 RepID=A0A484HCL5_9BACT|nr:AMP-dependent synthetase [uncultured Desulfobacteraceae bacterium]